MLHRKPVGTTVFLLLSSLLICLPASSNAPRQVRLSGVPRIRQLTNYCGPASLAAIMQYYGKKVTQEDVGKSVYDAGDGATNGADMLYYSRKNGFAAYSWNSSVNDIKMKIADGVPVLVLQQNSAEDASGHYRVLYGYDDDAGKFFVMDPYYDNITEMSYAECEQLWRKMGHWALLIVPPTRDSFKSELDGANPVVHMDLSYATYKRKDYDTALKEAKAALELEPGNSYAISMVGKIRAAMGAGKK